ncbi:class I SAM-dependent methyltransferase [Planktothrix agardhii 1032]|uniref:class I SAM-dependent methyltransferase n=1 Tax=Planktothrix agardhii TaxID=1160 RepID=UPI001D0B335F|nr:class I SAM-dependent methyltransferase [Planktothrix agardhii]MCB8776056.1 class I SAM-dependent methyltransferase [Planktothrix agardhii 1031]MCF3600437.1 class I SAM-dependent methyltransferase [Planktothrix agardhii 1032]
MNQEIAYENRVISVEQYEEILRAKRISLIQSYPYPKLQRKHTDGCILLPTREDMIHEFPKESICCEIGVANGDFSEKILAINKPRKLHLIDIWDSERYGEGYQKVLKKFSDEIQVGKIEINLGLSLAKLNEFDDNYFDWIYLDTVHDYKTTIQELSVASKKVKKGGIISGHDYCQGNMFTGWSYGVIQAVQEFLVREDWHFIYLTAESHCYLSFAITKI